MLIYTYNPITKEYTGAIEPSLDRVATKRTGKNVYYKMPFATEIEPPQIQTGYVAVFKTDKWVIEEDHRGQTIYNMSNRESKVYSEIGEIPVGYTLVAPERVEELQAKYLQVLKANFNEYMYNNKMEIPSIGLSFTYDSVERLKNEQLNGIQISRDDNNKIYSLTSEEYDTIINYLVIYGQYMYLQKWLIENTINKCTNVEILRTHQEELVFKVNPKLINSIVKMKEAKRKEYFAHMAEDIK